jgi:hypothetical protein
MDLFARVRLYQPDSKGATRKRKSKRNPFPNKVRNGQVQGSIIRNLQLPDKLSVLGYPENSRDTFCISQQKQVLHREA